MWCYLPLTFQGPQSLPLLSLHLKKSLSLPVFTVLGREISAFSLIEDSESFSHLFHWYAYSILVVLLWAGFHKILCEAKPHVDSFSLAFPRVVCWMLSLCAFWRVGLAFCTCSLAICKGLLLPSLGTCTESSHEVGECGGEAHEVLGCLWGSWWDLRAVQLLVCEQASWWGSLKESVVSTSPWCVSLRALTAVLPATHCYPVIQLTAQDSRWCEKEKGLFGRVLHQQTRHSHFSLSEKSWSMKVLALSCAILGNEWCL